MKRGFLQVALVFTILLVVAGWLFAKPVFLSFEDPVDIYAEDFDIIEHGEGGRIKTEIYASLGNCASFTTTTTNKSGHTTSSSTDYYFVVPVWDENEEEYYICVEVDEDDYSLYNRITSATSKYFDGISDSLGTVTAEFEGTIEELNDELYDYMLDAFRDIDYYESETELRSHALPLVLTSINFDVAPTYIGIFIVLLALTILFWILFFVKRNKTNVNNSMAMNGMSGATLNDVPVNNVPQYGNNPYNAQYNTQYNTGYNNQYNNYQGGAAYGSPIDTITIKGVSYPKAAVDQVNSYVITGQTVVAIKTFRELSGLSLAESKDVIDNWSQHYR